MRKIIQIEVVCREHCIPDLIALCDDGTLWKAQIMSGYETKWQSFATPVPQPRPDVRPDFELLSSTVPTIGEQAVRTLLEEDIARIKTIGGHGFQRDVEALEAHIAQKGLEVLRPSGLWFAGVHHGRKNP